jgi:hypothetical protein
MARPFRVTPTASVAAGTERQDAPGPLLLVAALDTGLLEQLAVLLLGHPLAALLDD